MKGQEEGCAVRRRFTLTWKLVVAILGAMALPVAVLIGLSLYLEASVRQDVEQKIETTLNLAMNMEESLLDEGLAEMRQTAVVVAGDPEVAAGLTGEDAQPVLERYANTFPRADLLVLVDRQGRVVAGAAWERKGGPLRMEGLVPRAMEEGKTLSYPALIPPEELAGAARSIRALVDMPILETKRSTDPRAGGRVATALVLAGVAPVQGADGTIVGAVVAADVLNRDFRIVDEVARRSPEELRLNATIAMDGIRVTTNVRLVDQEGNLTQYRALGTIYSDEVMEKLRAGEEYRRRAFVVNHWQRTIYRPLRDYQGKVIAGPYVGIPEQYFTAVGTRHTRSVTIAIAVSLFTLPAAAVALAWLGRRAIVLPVQSFTRQLKEGNLESRIRHPANDEIGDLAQALDKLLERVREAIGQVRGVADEVARATGALHDSASRTSEEVTRALTMATGSLRAAEELAGGARQTMERLQTLDEAMTVIADGTRHQERSVQYIGKVTAEIAGAMAQDRERMERALEACTRLGETAREALKQAAAFTAGLALARQWLQRRQNGSGSGGSGQQTGAPQGDAALWDLLEQDPSPLLEEMATLAEQLAEEVRFLALTSQENQARLKVIHQEMDRVAAAVQTTADRTQAAGRSAAAVVDWVERMAGSSAEMHNTALFTQSAMAQVAEGNQHLNELSRQLMEHARRLHEMMGRLKELSRGE